MHIKGALVNGVTKDEIREIFMQVAIYAGVPAGVDSFRIAREVFADGQGLGRMRPWTSDSSAWGKWAFPWPAA